MAVLEWCDTFDHYDIPFGSTVFSAGAGSKKWTTAPGGDLNDYGVGPEYARPGAPGGGNGWHSAAQNSGRGWLKNLPGGSQATRTVSFWIYFEAFNATNQPVVAWYDGGAEQCSIRVDASQHLTVQRTTTVLATSTNTLSVSTWYHIQFKATINNTTGAYEVRVNGSSTGWIPSATGANTRAATNNSASQVLMGNFAGLRFDDFAVTDDFPGVVAGAFIAGAAPGNYQQWTPNSGDNRGAVAQDWPDGDNSFVSDSTSGHKDTFIMEDVPSGGTPTIVGIQHVLYAKQDAGTPRTIRPIQRSGSTDYNGTSVVLGASYNYITEAVSTNPATGAAYTKANIDAAEFGYENV